MTSLWAFLLAIAILVGVHEYGHYKVAVLLGVKVLRFSLGFGPVIYRSTMGQPIMDARGQVKGETEFVVSLIPLGGYVSFLDENSDPSLNEDWSRAFHRQSLWRRSLIVLAGPMANFALALTLLWAMNWIGFESASAVLSTPVKGSLAERASIPSAARVMKLGLKGQELQDIHTYLEFEREVLGALSEHAVLELELEVKAPRSASLAVAGDERSRSRPSSGSEPDALPGPESGSGSLFPSAPGAQAVPEDPSGSASLGKSAYAVVQMRHLELDLSQFEMPLSRTSAEEDELTSKTGPRRATELQKAIDEDPKAVMALLGFVGPWTPAVLGRVNPGGAAARAGLQEGDQILAINHMPVADAYDLRMRIASSAELDPMQVQSWTVHRPGTSMDMDMQVEPEIKMQGGKKVGRIEAYVGSPPESVWFSQGPWGALQTGSWTLFQWTHRTVSSIYQLFSGQAPLAQIGGPIALAQYAGESVHMGLAAFLSYLALVSINLGVFNLLPLPPLDGGHLLTYAWQGLRGRALSERFSQGFQKVGLFLILALSVFALRNDLLRLLGMVP